MKDAKRYAPLGGLEPPTFRLTAERANRLRHRDMLAATDLYHIKHITIVFFASRGLLL